jgi:hypothetical protein
VHTGFWLGDLREIDHLEYLCIDGRLLLKWVLKKWEGRHGLG